MSDDLAISVQGLSKHYRLGVINHGTLYRDLQSWWAKLRSRPDPNVRVESWSHHPERVEGDLFHALEDISFDVRRGEILGIVGGNGAGKSTLLKILSRITAPSSGTVSLKGRIASLLEVGTGFHPELTGRENIYLNGAILGMSRREVARKFDEIVAFAEVSDFIDTPVKRYSSGMYVRLAFSVAAHLESEILLIDEVLAVGDVSFQRKCLGKMKDVGSSGRTVLFVSHNMAAVEKLCTRTVVLKNGRLDFDGDVREGVAHYFSSFEKTAHEGLDVSRRTGNGRARVVEAWTTDGDGAPMHIARSGQEVRFHVRIRPHHQCKDVLLALGITTLSDEGILHMSTETGGFEIERIDNDMIFTCKIDRLPLRAGLYAINIYMASGGAVLDYLIDAIRFQVEDADFYGTGKLPPHEGYPHFLVDFTWSSTSAS